MGWNSNAVKLGENVLGDAVIQHAFSVNNFMLLRVKRGCVILEELDKRTGLRAFIKNLGLALVNTAATVHGFSRISKNVMIGFCRYSRGLRIAIVGF